MGTACAASPSEIMASFLTWDGELLAKGAESAQDSPMDQEGPELKAPALRWWVNKETGAEARFVMTSHSPADHDD